MLRRPRGTLWRPERSWGPAGSAGAWLAASAHYLLPAYLMALAAAACCKNHGRWVVSCRTEESGKGRSGREAGGPLVLIFHPAPSGSTTPFSVDPYR